MINGKRIVKLANPESNKEMMKGFEFTEKGQRFFDYLLRNMEGVVEIEPEFEKDIMALKEIVELETLSREELIQALYLILRDADQLPL